jgi:alpha-ketoglutarate-dependent taurine dioxygenase
MFEAHTRQLDLRSALAEKGWLDLGTLTEQALRDLAHALGRPLRSTRNGDILDELVPLDPPHARKRSMSATHGRGPFPLHTDGAHHLHPPRFVLMRARSATPCDTSICLLDALWRAPERIAALSHAHWLVTDGLAGFYAPLIMAGGTGVRWDPCCMRPASKSGVASIATMDALISTSTAVRLKWQSNSGVLIDNWRVLHGRGDASATPSRAIERIMVAS